MIGLKKRHLRVEQPAGLEHAVTLGERPVGVRHVFEHALQDDEVGARVCEGQRQCGGNDVRRPRIEDVYVDDPWPKIGVACADVQDHRCFGHRIYD